ncbi:MAG: S-layer homology domain-containing protein, partial [Negativicutes bacterium]|nr:S-layer homology domain-containing protein [Negativicutes bacterium]
MPGGTGLAAPNPSFSDVPAGHWAYGAVTKLAQSGLIAGYEDGSFQGTRPMNRYEFALLTAKTIDRYDRADAANQKLIDDLSAEFASELNKMGARLARVEAKTNTWVGGDTRLRVIGDAPKTPGANKLRGSDMFDFRQRIKFWGTVNDDVSWQGRLSSNWGNKFGNTDSPGTANTYGSAAFFDMLNITAKHSLGFDSVRVGRSPLDTIGYGLIGKPLSVDGLGIWKSFGDMKFNAWTGNIKTDTNLGTGVGDSGRAYQLTTAQTDWKLDDNFNLGLGYYWSCVPGSNATMNINAGSFASSRGYDLSEKYKMGKVILLGDYVGSTLNRASGLASNPRAWAIQLSNGTGPGATAVYYSSAFLVNPSQAGTDAWSVSYRS